jgi:hypothetical protein
MLRRIHAEGSLPRCPARRAGNRRAAESKSPSKLGA